MENRTSAILRLTCRFGVKIAQQKRGFCFAHAASGGAHTLRVCDDSSSGSLVPHAGQTQNQRLQFKLHQ